jgi:hypothetical protein
MRSIPRLIGSRLLPALLTAMGVVLITGGLLSYADPTTAGPIAQASLDAATDAPTDEPTNSPDASPGESAEPGESPSGSLDPNASPPASIVPDPTLTATPDPTKRPGRAVATRVVVPALNIDLPVVKGNDGYPLCNVAMYLHTANSAARDAFGQPGEGRATYLYGHARDGMFGPIYEIAMVKKNPKKFLGMIVQVYTSDDKLYLYEIDGYRLHAVGAAALEPAINADSEELWLQTSEGPKGTPGKTQLIAKPVSVTAADHADANPKAKPVVCG